MTFSAITEVRHFLLTTLEVLAKDIHTLPKKYQNHRMLLMKQLGELSRDYKLMLARGEYRPSAFQAVLKNLVQELRNTDSPILQEEIKQQIDFCEEMMFGRFA